MHGTFVKYYICTSLTQMLNDCDVIYEIEKIIKHCENLSKKINKTAKTIVVVLCFSLLHIRNNFLFNILIHTSYSLETHLLSIIWKTIFSGDTVLRIENFYHTG